MGTTAVCGYNGTVSLGGEIRKWTFTEEIETLDATSMSSVGEKEYIACLKKGSGTIETLSPIGDVGAQASAEFTNDLDSFTADIIVTNINVPVVVNGIVVYSYSFETTGSY